MDINNVQLFLSQIDEEKDKYTIKYFFNKEVCSKDISFNELTEILKKQNIDGCKIKNGKLQLKSTLKANRLGFNGINNKKRNMMIVGFWSSNASDIIIQFDDGAQVKKKWAEFKKGQIAHPDDKVSSEKVVGEVSYNNKGLKMTIKSYRNSKDFIVVFEDGAEVVCKSKKTFTDGKIAHPNDKDLTIKYLGRTNLNTKKQRMCICNVLGCEKDGLYVDVKFYDGAIAKHVRIDHFNKGIVLHPKEKKERENRIGTEIINNKSRKAVCIAFRNCTDFDIQFEDKIILNCNDWTRFKQGRVAHPADTNRSLPEKILCYYLMKAYISYIPSFKADWLGHSNRSLDIYIPSLKLAIEYDGVQYHCSPNNIKGDKLKNSILSKSDEISKFIRIREEGCPILDKVDKLDIFETKPFRKGKEGYASLTKSIKEILRYIGLNESFIDDVRVDIDVVKHCNSDEFILDEYNLLKR